MKNFLYKFTFALILATSITSCVTVEDDFDDDRPDRNANHFNPPSWIQGRWVVQNGFDAVNIIYEFTANDYLEEFPNLGFVKSYNQLINESVSYPDQRVSVDEKIISTTQYKFSIISQLGTSDNRDYRYFEDDKIILNHLDDQSNVVLQDTLIRYER